MKTYEILEETKKRCTQCGMTNCSCKQGIPPRLADQLTHEQQDNSSGTLEKIKAAFKGQSPVNDKVKYGDTAYPKDKKSQQSVKETKIPGKGFKKAVAEAGKYGSRNPDTMSPGNYDRYQQDQMDYNKRAFKRSEMEHELGDEEQEYQRLLAKQKEKDRGPWYLRVNGKILKSQGEPKMFDWKKGANNYALAILKNKPELQGKIMLTRRPQDDETVVEIASSGATTAGDMTVGAVQKNQRPKMQKPSDNALDGDNLLTGGSIKR